MLKGSERFHLNHREHLSQNGSLDGILFPSPLLTDADAFQEVGFYATKGLSNPEEFCFSPFCSLIARDTDHECRPAFFRVHPQSFSETSFPSRIGRGFFYHESNGFSQGPTRPTVPESVQMSESFLSFRRTDGCFSSHRCVGRAGAPDVFTCEMSTPRTAEGFTIIGRSARSARPEIAELSDVGPFRTKLVR